MENEHKNIIFVLMFHSILAYRNICLENGMRNEGDKSPKVIYQIM